jgi:hypothetical protein
MDEPKQAEEDRAEGAAKKVTSLSGRLIYDEKRGQLEFVVDEVQPDHSRAYEYIDKETGEKVWIVVVNADRQPRGKEWVEQFD